MSARVLDFQRAARDAKVRSLVDAIEVYNLEQKNTYTPADIARAAPSWTIEMWRELAKYASELEGRVVHVPSPITQAEVVAYFEEKAKKLVVAKALAIMVSR